MSEKRRAYQKEYKKRYDAKNKRVNLTLADDEYRDFVRHAKKTKVTSYIKQLAIAGLNSQTVLPDNIEEELKTLRFAIRNIANNINQIAHHSNTMRGISSEAEHSVFQYLKQLEDVVESYTKGKILQAKKDDN
jgi:hypothetical protein